MSGSFKYPGPLKARSALFSVSSSKQLRRGCIKVVCILGSREDSVYYYIVMANKNQTGRGCRGAVGQPFGSSSRNVVPALEIEPKTPVTMREYGAALNMGIC